MNINWEYVRFFKPTEFVSPELMSPILIYALDALRAKVGRPFIVHSSYRGGDEGTHGKGLAVDGHFDGVPLIDQFLAAEKSLLFGGIGLYPHWNNPGIHVDVRNVTKEKGGARWGRNAAGVYVALDSKFLIECM